MISDLEILDSLGIALSGNCTSIDFLIAELPVELGAVGMREGLVGNLRVGGVVLSLNLQDIKLYFFVNVTELL